MLYLSSPSKPSLRLLFIPFLFLLLSTVNAAAWDGSVNPDLGTTNERVKSQVSRTSFRHRHSFSYNLKSRHDGLSRFQMVDTQDILRYAELESPHLTYLDLSARNRLSPSKMEFQHRLGGEHEITEPNITDKETIVNLAKMTSDAYIYDPTAPDWLNTSLGFNFTRRFGWPKDGLRGHVFTTEDNSTVVVSIKGTTIDPRDKLSGRDRINDNRLFSCCCGAQSPFRWPTVCDCATGYNQCSIDCLTTNLLQNDTYYDAALFLFTKFKARYPRSAFWTVGHSLGGSLASLVGMTLNIPAVTFEAPAERLAAERMGLIPISSAGRHSAYHFGNTADPIFMSECNGYLSSCALAGYVFDSKCFSGSRCVYDTRKDKGWRSNVLNHRINYVIENVLETYDKVPICEAQINCVDCAGWNFTSKPDR